MPLLVALACLLHKQPVCRLPFTTECHVLSVASGQPAEINSPRPGHAHITSCEVQERASCIACLWYFTKPGHKGPGLLSCTPNLLNTAGLQVQQRIPSSQEAVNGLPLCQSLQVDTPHGKTAELMSPEYTKTTLWHLFGILYPPLHYRHLEPES